MKTTKWFPGDVQPVRTGAYLRKYKYRQERYCWWDNGWGMAASTPYWAKLARGEGSFQQALPWRGLAKEPKQ